MRQKLHILVGIVEMERVTLSIIPMLSKYEHSAKLFRILPHESRVVHVQCDIAFISTVKKDWTVRFPILIIDKNSFFILALRIDVVEMIQRLFNPFQGTIRSVRTLSR